MAILHEADGHTRGHRSHASHLRTAARLLLQRRLLLAQLLGLAGSIRAADTGARGMRGLAGQYTAPDWHWLSRG